MPSTAPHRYLHRNGIEAASIGKPVLLHPVIVSGVLALGVATIYDSASASGTKVAVIDGSLVRPSLDFGGAFLENGLTIDITGAAIDVTAVYTAWEDYR